MAAFLEFYNSYVAPYVDSAVDLGASDREFNDLYIDGMAYIDGFGESTLFSSSNQIQFRDTDIYINSLNDGYLDLTADTAIRLNNNTAITGTLSLTGVLTTSHGTIEANASASQTISLSGTGGSYPQTLTIHLDNQWFAAGFSSVSGDPFWFQQGITMNNNEIFWLSNQSLGGFRWYTGQTNNNLQVITSVGSSTNSGYFCLVGNSDKTSANRNPGTSADPVFRVYASGTTATHYIEQYHDQTDATIDWGSGALNLTGGNVNIDSGTISTTSADNWDLNDYTASAVVDTGYIDVTINGTAYKILARLEP